MVLRVVHPLLVAHERSIFMAKDETKRLKPEVIDKDKKALIAAHTFPEYSPWNEDYKLDKVDAKKLAMELAQADEVKAKVAYETARDTANGKEWVFHNAILGIKEQVIGQYGHNSDEYQALGLKKKSEFKKPGGRKPKE
jgi:hypothetical protein